MTEPAPQPAAPAAPLSEAEDKQWASFAHFGNILSFIAPLIIWLIFKDRGTKTNVEGKEALNWGINVAGLLDHRTRSSSVISGFTIVMRPDLRPCSSWAAIIVST